MVLAGGLDLSAENSGETCVRLFPAFVLLMDGTGRDEAGGQTLEGMIQNRKMAGLVVPEPPQERIFTPPG